MSLLDDFMGTGGFTQLYGASNTFDTNVGANPASNNLPFYTLDNGDGTGQVAANPNTGGGFWSSFGSGLSFLTNTATNVLKADPNLINQISGNSAPNPANTVNGARQTSAGSMPSLGGFSMGWIVAGIAALFVLVGGFLLLRPRKGR